MKEIYSRAITLSCIHRVPIKPPPFHFPNNSVVKNYPILMILVC